MSDKSAIEWTDATWNPIRARNLKTGKIGWHCEHATTGCEFCYADGFNRRLGTGLPFKPGHRKDIEIFLDDGAITVPMRWKKPRMIFVCSMTDLFADFVKDEWIDRVFAVMALCPQHTFQVLTKRADRLHKYIDGVMADQALGLSRFGIAALWTGLHGPSGKCAPWPLPNVWLGVSCERQEEANERIPFLLQTPAAIRFVSAEPLLGPIHGVNIPNPDGGVRTVDWVIVGGESGRNAREMDVEWARGLRRYCEAYDIPFFFKQWGEWRPSFSGRFTGRVGKKAAGRLLDGREHNGFPEAARP